MEENRSSIERAAVPLRFREGAAPRRELLGFPAPFVFRPTADEIAAKQQEHGSVEIGFVEKRPQTDGLVEVGLRFAQLSLSAQRPSCCVHRHSPVSVPGPGGSRQPPRPAPLVGQCTPQIAVRLGAAGLQFQGPAVAGNRFVQLPLGLERIAQVVVRLGIVRFQFQGPAVAGNRFVQLPWSFNALPRLLCSSAKSGFSSKARR